MTQVKQVREGFVVTVQIILDVDSYEEAVDFVSEMLSVDPPEEVIDWSYLKIGGQYLYPTRIVIPANYEEGDAFV